jgi:hypothetical protein
MRSIFNGKTYDTTTAEQICSLSCDYHPGDARRHGTALYMTKKGAFFLSGSGGPLSMWAIAGGQNTWGSGSGLRVISQDEARAHMECAGCEPHEFEHCGLTLEEG